MPNYQNGKIYSIRSYHTDEIYIGSTVNTLSRRMTQHRCDYKTGKKLTSSGEILKYGDAYIELLSLYPCNSKDELEREEGSIIRTMNCVNKRIEGRTQKEYYLDNKDKIKEYQKEYRIDNIDKMKLQKKEYDIKNKDKIKQYKKNNKDKRKEYDIKYRAKLFYNKLQAFILN